MNNLILHPVTRRQIDDFVSSPSHAVMLAGPVGSGKQTMATKLSEAVLELPAGTFTNYPYKLIIGTAEGKSIGIEAVRELEHFLTLKVPRAATHNRAVVIEAAHLLTAEAQNALLKTLEEPPAGTLIILSVNHEKALLPTVRSRAQLIDIKRPAKADVQDHFKLQNFDDKAIIRAYAISGGLPGLMQALLNQIDHPLTQATEMARQLLSQSPYERLLSVDELSKQREHALNLCFILQQMAHVSLQNAKGATAKKWQDVLTASYEAAEALSGSAQPKLALTKLMLGF